MARFGILLTQNPLPTTAAATQAGWSHPYWLQLVGGLRQPPRLSRWSSIRRAVGPDVVASAAELQARLILESLWWSFTEPGEAAAAHLIRQFSAYTGHAQVITEVIHDEIEALPRRRRDGQSPTDVATRLAGLSDDPAMWPRHVTVNYLCHRVSALHIEPQAPAPIQATLDTGDVVPVTLVGSAPL